MWQVRGSSVHLPLVPILSKNFAPKFYPAINFSHFMLPLDIMIANQKVVSSLASIPSLYFSTQPVRPQAPDAHSRRQDTLHPSASQSNINIG